MEGKSGLLIQSIIPYIAVTLEAFVFCFAGEYLSTKVSTIPLLLMASECEYFSLMPCIKVYFFDLTTLLYGCMALACTFSSYRRTVSNRLFSSFSEQVHQRCRVRDTLVRVVHQRMSNLVIDNCQISKTTDDHGGKSHGSDFGRFYKCKIFYCFFKCGG